MSYENFLRRALVNLHPVCPHAAWLYSVDVNAILDGGETEKKCNEIGQLIFDHYKNQKGNSEAGIVAVKRVCQAARVLTDKGGVRSNHINFAWAGIGDDNWRWMR